MHTSIGCAAYGTPRYPLFLAACATPARTIAAILPHRQSQGEQVHEKQIGSARVLGAGASPSLFSNRLCAGSAQPRRAAAALHGKKYAAQSNCWARSAGGSRASQCDRAHARVHMHERAGCRLANKQHQVCSSDQCSARQSRRGGRCHCRAHMRCLSQLRPAVQQQQAIAAQPQAASSTWARKAAAPAATPITHIRWQTVLSGTKDAALPRTSEAGTRQACLAHALV